MAKIRVAILMGGPSSEHEISLKTGEMIVKNLSKKNFEVLPVKIKPDGTWPITIDNLKKKIDVAFVALHGEYGEDGQVQSLLETFDIPYTGSNPLASALAMNKRKSSPFLAQNGFFVPKAIFIKKGDSQVDWASLKKWRLPVVVKPTDRGSSVGVSIIKKLGHLGEAVNRALKYSDSLMIEQYIKGREVTCGVVDINRVSIPLVPTEIIPKKGEFFDYASKYDINGSDEITPPRLPAKTIKEIQLTALRAHKFLGCSGMSRTDMILEQAPSSKHQAPKLYVLEVNTIPGMTQTSLLPQGAAKMGIGFSHLLEILIKAGLNRKA